MHHTCGRHNAPGVKPLGWRLFGARNVELLQLRDWQLEKQLGGYKLEFIRVPPAPPLSSFEILDDTGALETLVYSSVKWG